MPGRLDDSLDLLAGGPVDAPTRHRALREAIGWSYDLLDPDLGILFGRLGVFDGAFSLSAAHAVAGQDLADSQTDALNKLSELIDQSLLQMVESVGTEPRFRLHDSVREFAVSVVDDEKAARGRHLDY